MLDQNKLLPLEFPIKAETLVPHRPPMLFVDCLLERSGDTAKGRATFPTSGICFSSDRLLPEFYIELIAQTCAMAKGYDCLKAGSALRSGMLVGLDSFKFQPIDYKVEKLIIEVDKKFEFGSITLIEGKVWAGDSLLAQGEIKVWEDFDGDGEI